MWVMSGGRADGRQAVERDNVHVGRSSCQSSIRDRSVGGGDGGEHFTGNLYF